MFSGLRLQLTALYLLASLALIALMGAGAYLLLGFYFQSVTDLALQHKMAAEFRLLGEPLPAELAAADRDWYANQPQSIGRPRSWREDDEEREHGRPLSDEESLDGELAAIYVLPLAADGSLALGAASGSGLAPYAPAALVALSQGRDLRTVELSDGSRARLLTYPLTSSSQAAALQVGRTLGDQDRVLARLLAGLLALGAAGAALVGATSWWLAGRSLRPAQLAWEQQQVFVASASHELRTPLTLLRASTEVALRSLPADDADRRELLQDALHETDHMSKLVEDLLLLSRLDAGRLQIVAEAIPLPDLLTDIQRQVGRLAEERGVDLALQAQPCVAWGDTIRLRQVLLIVLDNALHHTPPGGSITIRAAADHRPAADHRAAKVAPFGARRPSAVTIEVEDTGAGIPPEHLPHVFDRFYRADSARGASGNAGLGLSIARGLVEAQHGRIAIASRHGHGTRVTITLPARSVTDL